MISLRERSSSFRKAIESEPGGESESESLAVKQKHIDLEEKEIRDGRLKKERPGDVPLSPRDKNINSIGKDRGGGNCGDHYGNNYNDHHGNNGNGGGIGNGKRKRRSKRRPVSETESFSGGEEKLKRERSRRAVSEIRTESSR